MALAWPGGAGLACLATKNTLGVGLAVWGNELGSREGDEKDAKEASNHSVCLRVNLFRGVKGLFDE